MDAGHLVNLSRLAHLGLQHISCLILACSHAQVFSEGGRPFHLSTEERLPPEVPCTGLLTGSHASCAGRRRSQEWCKSQQYWRSQPCWRKLRPWRGGRRQQLQVCSEPKLQKMSRHKSACAAGCARCQRPALQAHELCSPSAAELAVHSGDTQYMPSCNAGHV